MKPTWLIERDVFQEGNPERIAQVASKLGCKVQWYNYFPFAGEVEHKPHGRDIIPYGSINAMKLFQRENWSGLFCDFRKLRYLDYTREIEDLLLNSTLDCYQTYLSKLTTGKHDFLYTLFCSGYSENLFIRPNSNSKPFAGQLVHYEKLKEFADYQLGFGASPDELVIITVPQKIKEEYRFVICDGSILTGSKYLPEVERVDDWDINLINFINIVCFRQKYFPHKFYTLDIALLEDGSYKLIEIGSINCSGLYACNIEEIVTEITRYVSDW